MSDDKPARPAQPKTPMTDLANQLVRDNLKLLDFLAWLQARGRVVYAMPSTAEDWIAEFQGLDMDALTDERKAMLTYTVAMHRYWDDLDAWRSRQVGGNKNEK